MNLNLLIRRQKMGLVFRKTQKIRKSRTYRTSRKSEKQTRCLSHNQIFNKKLNKKLQIGGAARMIITYKTNTKSGNINGEKIQLTSGEMPADMTEQYNLGLLDKEPQLEITGLAPGKRYLLTMTDPDALGKTWTHWVAEIISNSNSNSARQLVRTDIAQYAPPKPPKDSGVHHYIFRLYDTGTLTRIPSPLKSMSRGNYFAIRLTPIIEGKPVLAEATYTIDSSKIQNKKGKFGGVGKGIGLGMQVGLDMIKAFAR